MPKNLDPINNLSAMPADLVQSILFWMGIWDEKSDLIPTDQRNRLAGDLDRMEAELQRFARECERRGIDGTPLNILGELVSKTRREHTDPLMFSQSLRRYVSPERVIELLRATVQRLLRKVEGELEDADEAAAGGGVDVKISPEQFSEISDRNLKHIQRLYRGKEAERTVEAALAIKRQRAVDVNEDQRSEKAVEAVATGKAIRECAAPTCGWSGTLAPETIDCPKCGARTRLATGNRCADGAPTVRLKTK
jgi:hypothetical protein